MFLRTLLTAAALLLFPAIVLAQAQPKIEPTPKTIEIPADGSELFRALLDRAGIKPIKEQDARSLLHAEDVIVIVMGTTNHNHHRSNFGNGLTIAKSIIDNGGAALIASDSALELATFNPGNRPHISSMRIKCHVPELTHTVVLEDGSIEAQPDCPYLIPIEPRQDLGWDAESPLTKLFSGDKQGARKLTRIATNSSSFLALQGFGGEMQQPLAKFPRGCVARRTDPWGTDTFKIEEALFAVGGYGTQDEFSGSYRFLAMADQSVFINQMLIEPGTENLELTYRVIEFLQGPTTRRRCLFIENGRVIEKFDDLRHAFAKPKPPLPMPNLGAMQEKLVDMGNKLVDDLQSRNVFNKALDRIFGLPSIVRLLLLLATLYGMWFILRRMFVSRKPTDLPQPPAVAGVATGPPGVFDRRQKELIRRNNIYEPVHDLVREYFASSGIHGEQGPKLPKLVISKAVRKPESLRMALRDFWKLAYGPPQEVSVNRWRELEVYFDRLRIAHTEGKWHFVVEAATVD